LFGADGQTDLPIGKDHAPKNKEQRNSTSQTKRHAMRPEASNESANGTPAIKRVRVAVRKVPRKMYEHAKDKSKKDNIKRGTGTIFGDDVSESSDEVLNTMSAKAAMGNSSSTSADSGKKLRTCNGIRAKFLLDYSCTWLCIHLLELKTTVFFSFEEDNCF
jgi:hypothetical protein